ncbi:MAG: hydrogenase maturation nickel metallochaperone HypA [Proteobacteria bacterium]|nr:hydrogenase maturation nickel metallochaperone HypA [Pseudomonadota bacterium]
MHELSLAGGILRIVEQTAEHEHFARLLRLRLEAGSLSGVDVRALSFALESMAPATVLEGAVIEIEEPLGRAWCMGCQQQIDVRARGDACPSCGSSQWIACGGTELRVVDMEVADA